MSTRWVWISEPDGGVVLAFTYVDPQAGPSAKGARVAQSRTLEQIRAAVDHPDRTFRDPAAFGAVPISAEEALRHGLPKDPPWIGVFEKKPIPPPRGEPARDVTVIATRSGAVVPAAHVKMGRRFGPSRSLFALDERTTDEHGRCVFPLAPMGPVAVAASAGDAGSAIVDVPEDGVVGLVLRSHGAVDGTTRRGGRAVPGRVTLEGEDGAAHVERGDESGRYRIVGVVPGKYRISVQSIDPKTQMSAGPLTVGAIEIAEGETLHRDYVLVSGVAVDVALTGKTGGTQVNVMLFRGSVAPKTAGELRALWQSLPASEYQSADLLTQAKNGPVRTRFVDVVAGEHTLCVVARARAGRTEEERARKPVTCCAVIVAAAPVFVSLDLKD